MLRQVALSLSLLVAAAAATPALAGAADGKWECRAFGGKVAVLTIKGLTYVVTDRDGVTGSGTLNAQAGDPASFSVAVGTLGTSLNVLVGRVSTNNGAPLLTLIEKDGDELLCTVTS